METETEVLLPTTTEALDTFVASITQEYGLPEGDDTYDAIATMILHLPHTKAYAPRSHFGNGVLKSLANKAAYDKLTEFREKRLKKEAEEKAKLTLVQDETSVEQPLQIS
jgi:hypothetical protein